MPVCTTWLGSYVGSTQVRGGNPNSSEQSNIPAVILFEWATWLIVCVFPYFCSENVNAYCLHIAEDDGEVDTDFPPLDSNEPIHKFGFSTLALVEKFSSPGLASRQSLFVRMLVCFYLLRKLETELFTRVSVLVKSGFRINKTTIQRRQARTSYIPEQAGMMALPALPRTAWPSVPVSSKVITPTGCDRWLELNVLGLLKGDGISIL